MVSTYSNLKIQLMAAGENASTWGNVTNVNLGTSLEEAIVGSADVAFSSGNVTISLTDTNATQTARNMRLNCTGTTGGARDLIVPAIEKVYIVNNGCADAITVKNSTGTGIAVAAGKTMWVYNNGTNVVDVVTHLSSLTLATPLVVAQGGTGIATLTGLVKGAGTSAFAAATAGTDYVAPATATTFTALQTFSGASTNAALKLINALEDGVVSATAATGTIAYDVTTQTALYYTSSAAANWVVNFRGSSGTTLDTVMSTGDFLGTAFAVTQGATAYYNTSVQVDGTAVGVTTKWLGGAPTAGIVSSVNIYSYVIVKTGSATFTVFASVAVYS